MGTDKAQAIYEERASTIETVNADLKTHHGLTQFMVRGSNKIKCVASGARWRTTCFIMALQSWDKPSK